jgi:DNA-binding transcriptional MerR regulator
MNYTVNTLAKLSSISIRTLRYYDEIGLLKPAFVGENGYRFYHEEQLLRLQQILFFKELGFELKQIQDILGRTDFDQLHALRSHAQEVQHRMKRLKVLAKTIDKTIIHLEGKRALTEKEMYYGLHNEKQKRYEKYILDRYGDNAKKLMAESKKNTANWTEEEWDKYKSEGSEINSQLIVAIKKGLKADSLEVQNLVARHYGLIIRMYHPTKEVYVGLGKFYCTHPEFRAFFNNFHQGLAEFLAESMKIYADKNL